MNIEITLEQVCDVCNDGGQHCYSCNSHGKIPNKFGSDLLDFIEKYMEVSVSVSSSGDVESTAWATLRRK